jgi:predicted O-linked N-acetylglucosamine transferase (SPINDLY family)
LGAAHRHLSEYEAAKAAYEQALRLKPDYVQPLSNLGEWCIAQGQPAQAVVWFDKALAVAPRFFEARLNKTAALYELARYADARELAEQLVADEPSRAEAFLNLGNILVQTGKARQGVKHYKKALALQPGYPEAHFNLSSLLGSRDDLSLAIDYLKRRIKERGDSVQNLCMLASAQQAAGHLTQAQELCQRILERHPDNLNALITLGSCLSTSGDSAAAVKLYERVVELDKSQTGVGSNILFEHNNLAGTDRALVFGKHQKWAKLVEPLESVAQAFEQRSRDPERKLRIGYVSGDFINHPVGMLLSDVLQRHDKAQFSVHCFSMVIRPEDVLPALRAGADEWEDVFLLDDDELFELIRKSEIDILVDLSGHTAFHRLPVFARRPAPVQVEWIGYFHSTGMDSVDYFITDPYTSPRESGQLFSETPACLPSTRFCYGPPAYAPGVAELPLASRCKVTLGSFNRLAKVNDEVVEAWCRVLHAVPESRMVVKAGALAEEQVVKRLQARFESHGIGAERLELREGSPHAEMLAEYGDIDIALDTFPFNGGATTFEALWMGVPVVTIAGDTVVSRQTASALANIGLADELAFPDVDAYVAGAIALAQNPTRLAELRHELRPRMEASPLRQSKQFTKDLEDLYRRMWVAWCEGRKLESDVVGCPVQATVN